MSLWPHQARARAGVIQAWRDGARRVLVVCPTGGGKTRLATDLAASYLGQHAAAGGRVVWLAHRDELVAQAAATLRAAGLEVGVDGLGSCAPVQVATVQTLLAREEVPRASLVVADEAHHYVEGNDWHRVISAYVGAGARVLGLTATPQRRDGRGLGEGPAGFERLIVAAQVRELQEAGFLVRCRVHAPAHRLKPTELAREPVEAYVERAPNGRAVVFAPHEQACTDYATGFARAGIPWAIVLGRTPTDRRERALADFAAGRVRVLVNVFVLTEGWDCPSCDTIIIARGCDSAGTYLQMTGRGLRACDGKSYCDLLDLRGVSHDHGLPDEDRDFFLEGRAIRRRALVGAPLCKLCNEPLPEDAVRCPRCARERDPQTTPRGIGAELQERYAGMEKLPPAKQIATLAGIMRKGRSAKQSALIFSKMFKRWPRRDEIDAATRMIGGERA